MRWPSEEASFGGRRSGEEDYQLPWLECAGEECHWWQLDCGV